MTSLQQLYATDESKEAEGFWHEITDTISIRMARAGGMNSRFAKALEQKIRPHRRKIENEDMDITLANTIMREVFAETVVMDWKGVNDDEGKPLPCTKENVLNILTELPDLFAELREVAGRQANFRATTAEEDLGN